MDKQRDFFTSPSLSCPHGFFMRGTSDKYGRESLNFAHTTSVRTVSPTSEHVALEMLGLKKRLLVLPQQVHKNNVVYVNATQQLKEPCDALITDDPTIVIGVITADCVPVLIETKNNKDKQIVGTIHAGWRGTLAGIVQNTVCQINKMSQAPLRAVIGPCIAQESYSVGTEVRDHFAHQKFDAYFCKKVATSNKQSMTQYSFDLSGVVRMLLREMGVVVTQIAKDTYHYPALFFSYRYSTHHRMNTYGCQLSAIGPI